MRSLLLALLLLTPSSSVFGQEENPVPSNSSGSREGRMEGFLKQIDANHDGQIDAEEVQAAGPRAGMIEGPIRRAGLEPKYPIKISDIQAGMQKARTNGGQAVDESAKEPPKVKSLREIVAGAAIAKEPPKFKTIKEILEALPRKPEKGDNVLASRMANQWLQTNVLGNTIQISGRLSSIDGNASVEGGFVQLSLEKRGLWEGYNFDLRASAQSARHVNLNDFSKIVQGDMVTLEGKISYLEMRWEKGKGTLQLQMADCKLISVAPANASDRVDEPIRKFALAVLRQNDKDGSGALEKDKGEWSEVRDAQSIDKDHNGIITLDELAVYYQAKNAPNANPANLFEATDAPKQPDIKINTGTITITGDAVRKPSKFWTGTTDSGECAVRLDEIHFVSLIEAKTNDPAMWRVLFYLKTKNDPIPLSFKDAEKAHAVYQNLLQALESGSEKVVEGIGKHPEAGLRGTVRMQNAPVEKRKPPEEKQEKGLFD